MKVDDMPAGPQLDALVAEKVMGWKRCDQTGQGIAPDTRPVESQRGFDLYGVSRIPGFSTDTKAAMQVAERLSEEGWKPRYVCCDKIHSRKQGLTTSNWYVAFYKPEAEAGYIDFEISFPLAICRAALKAVGVTEVPDSTN